MERQTTQKHPWIKWLTIGFLGTLGILCLFVTILAFKFSPILSVDEKSGLVEILGGMVTVHAADDDVTVDVKDLKVENNQLNGKVKVHTKGDKVTVDVQGMNIKTP